ncbi:cupin domain-containing protein [Raineyella sp.]|uniref:cupin domain-containing protein n=1 Tax=Raineyella sp. TaxID=1911550 RepID=UPI002B1EAB54|nr:cupin domain-containing protein [Raineyella sp.]MEA5155025.1 cupin domain-containing protein [Raineyella sp.]
MQSGRLDDLKPRYDDWGPAYVIQGPSSDIGLLTLRPGDEMTNHIHHFCDESFIILEGNATLWVDCQRSFALEPGDVHRCQPDEMHYFVNDSPGLFKMVFIKSPQSPGDTINLPWTPGQPAPEVPARPEVPAPPR